MVFNEEVQRICGRSYFRAWRPPAGNPTDTSRDDMAARKSRVPMVALALTVALMVGLPAWMVPNSFPSSRQNL